MAFSLASTVCGDEEQVQKAYGNVGIPFGRLFQILDDMGDVAEDDPSANIVASRGIDVAEHSYDLAEAQVRRLLSDLGIATPSLLALLTQLRDKRDALLKAV